MTVTALLLAAAALAAAEPGPAAAQEEEGGTFLLSIVGLPLGEGEYVDRFAIGTWGVRMLAVCRLPPGWYVRAGQSAAPDGDIEGEATHGVTFLDRARLDALRGLALVEIAGGVRPADGSEPPTFSGSAGIGIYGDGTGEPRRRLRLTSANIRLEPATRCPEPAR